MYREMEYRFRKVHRHGFELTFVGILWRGNQPRVGARFRFRETGDGALHNPTISLFLLGGIEGKLPERVLDESEEDRF